MKLIAQTSCFSVFQREFEKHYFFRLLRQQIIRPTVQWQRLGKLLAEQTLHDTFRFA